MGKDIIKNMENAYIYCVVAFDSELSGKFSPLSKCCEFERLVREHGESIKAALLITYGIVNMDDDFMKIREAVNAIFSVKSDTGMTQREAEELAHQAIAILDKYRLGEKK